MLILETGMKVVNFRGWTLIELLVVIFILALILSMITFSHGWLQNKSIVIKEHIRTFYSAIQLAQHQAILQQQTYRLQVKENQSNFERLANSFSPQNAKWISMNADRLLQVPSFPKNAKIIAHDKDFSQIILYPNGELSPFQISIYSGSDLYANLAGVQSGEIYLEWKR